MSIYGGIDVGAKGGIALLREADNVVLFLKPMSRENLIEAFSKFTPKVVCLEKVNAMPNQGVTSMFTFGKNAGFIEGVLESFKAPYQLIRPQAWKKEFGLNSDKQQSIDVCKQLFPNVNLLATERCRKENDGMAEALLMAVYAKRKL